MSPRIAFYAPLKAPDDPTPSGDREMARNLIAALTQGGAHQVDLVSRFQSRERSGDTTRQAELIAQAHQETQRLLPLLADQGYDLWLTYHNYYKAPDLLGPALSAALGIPYVQVESTRAKSRLSGRWAAFAQTAEAATDAARAVFYPTALDLITLKRDQQPGQSLINLPPFLPLTSLPPAAPVARNKVMLCAGMMRPGDKLASYEILAQTLSHLPSSDWTLQIAGDGKARPQVEALMAPFGNRVQFLGQLSPSEMASAYDNAALFVWPGVNEAFGMVYLEAQAQGLPIVAQNRDGVRDVLTQGPYPDPAEGPQALAHLLARYLQDPDLRARRSKTVRDHVTARHLLPAAARLLQDSLAPFLKGQP